MERQLAEWKPELDRIWSAHAPDYGEAVRLAQQIAGSARKKCCVRPLPRRCRFCAAPRMRMPTTRRTKRRGGGSASFARCCRRSPRRNSAGELTALKTLTAEERCRELLGLPLDRRLSESEIHRAYKLLAKRAHPDAGGNAEAFLKISAAHEVLMKERRMPRH